MTVVGLIDCHTPIPGLGHPTSSLSTGRIFWVVDTLGSTIERGGVMVEVVERTGESPEPRPIEDGRGVGGGIPSTPIVLGCHRRRTVPDPRQVIDRVQPLDSSQPAVPIRRRGAMITIAGVMRISDPRFMRMFGSKVFGQAGREGRAEGATFDRTRGVTIYEMDQIDMPLKCPGGLVGALTGRVIRTDERSCVSIR